MNPVKELIARVQLALGARRTAYLRCFTSPPGEVVLADLAKFCRATEPTFHPDPRVSAQLDGRREVFLRIQQHLRLTDDQLWKLYGERLNSTSDK